MVWLFDVVVLKIKWLPIQLSLELTFLFTKQMKLLAIKEFVQRKNCLCNLTWLIIWPNLVRRVKTLYFTCWEMEEDSLRWKQLAMNTHIITYIFDFCRSYFSYVFVYQNSLFVHRGMTSYRSLATSNGLFALQFCPFLQIQISLKLVLHVKIWYIEI